MLFRPEEIHGASGIGNIIEPLPERYGCIGYQTFWFGTLDRTIFHHHPHGRSAIKTRSIDLDCFSRKEPADRQRFEPSLGEPLLLSFNSGAILGREIVKGGERDYIVGIGK